MRSSGMTAELYRSWTQYTGTGYANPTRVILDAAVRTVREIRVDYHEKTYTSYIRPYFDLPFYRRLPRRSLQLARWFAQRNLG